MRHNKGRKIVFITCMVLLVMTALGGVVMTLWNWLVPTIFNGPLITYWQATGLFIFSKLLFGGFGGRGHGGWKNHWKSKFEHMSPGDRQRMKERFMHKWGCPRSGKGSESDKEESLETKPL